MSWEDVGFALKSKQRKELLLLIEIPKTPTQLAKRLKSSLPNISLKLKDLSDYGLIKCVNPNERKGRIYTLTSRGRATVRKIKDMEI